MLSTGVRFAIILLAGAVLPSEVSAAKAENGTKIISVVCPDSSLQVVVDAARGPTIIEVSGICMENIVIQQDDILIRNGAAGAEIRSPDFGCGAPTVEIDGARRVTLTGLTVTNGCAGIRLTNAASASLNGNVVEDNFLIGISVLENSWASMENNTVRSTNPVDGEVVGVYVSSSSVEMRDDVVVNNDCVGINGFCEPFGIEADQAAHIIARGVEVSGQGGGNILVSAYTGSTVELRDSGPLFIDRTFLDFNPDGSDMIEVQRLSLVRMKRIRTSLDPVKAQPGVDYECSVSVGSAVHVNGSSTAQIEGCSSLP